MFENEHNDYKHRSLILLVLHINILVLMTLWGLITHPHCGGPQIEWLLQAKELFINLLHMKWINFLFFD